MSKKKKFQLGDAPIEEDYAAQMVGIAQALDEALNEGKRGAAREVGFVVMVFPFGDKTGRCNFVSNGADRNDIVTLFKEMIQRFEGQSEMKGTA